MGFPALRGTTVSAQNSNIYQLYSQLRGAGEALFPPGLSLFLPKVADKTRFILTVSHTKKGELTRLVTPDSPKERG